MCVWGDANKQTKKTGKIKQFGTGPLKTICPFWLVSLCIALLAYVYLSVKEDEFV